MGWSPTSDIDSRLKSVFSQLFKVSPTGHIEPYWYALIVIATLASIGFIGLGAILGYRPYIHWRRIVARISTYHKSKIALI